MLEPVPSDRWADLWDRHADAVYAYAVRRVGIHDAADVVGEVFAVALAHPERVPVDGLPWLYRTAWNVVRNHWRARDRHRRPDSPTGQPTQDPGDLVAERDQWKRALRSLSELDREALLLTAWEGLDGTRAAAVIGCSVSAFAVRLHRARARLEAALEDAEAGPPDREVAP